MNQFYCNKRFDISFSDFHKLVKICLPTNYESRETRGLYKSEYQPCNIIAIKQKDDVIEQCIYCWLGQKGLTVLADNELTSSICAEALKHVKQNPEEFKMLSYNKVDKNKLLDQLYNDYLVYRQLNNKQNIDTYIIREYNGDEVIIELYDNHDITRLSGGLSSLFTIVQMAIEKLQNKAE